MKKRLPFHKKRFTKFTGITTENLITLTYWCSENYIAINTAYRWIHSGKIKAYKFYRWYVHKNQAVPPH